MKTFLRRISIILIVLVATVLIGTFVFSRLEGFSLFDSFYFTVVTVATVGYGDITPTHFSSKILAILIVLVGVGSFTGLVVNSTQFFVDRSTQAQRNSRLNTLVELFFSEVGTQLLRIFSSADPGLDALRAELTVDARTTEAGLSHLRKVLGSHPYFIEPERLELEALKVLLRDKADLVIRLLENPNLGENEAITELLRAAFHLHQELKVRVDLESLPASDLEHLANDAKRIYQLAARQWAVHLQDLKKAYPYLFSISLRTNPFGPVASPEVR